MYLQITTKCQMHCAHCCFDCGPKGVNMPLKVFRAALQLCKEYGTNVFLGGGEPTLHPHFDTILLESIAAVGTDDDGLGLGLVTNGGIKSKALMLAELTKKRVISGYLSQDEYHDKIDPEVIEAWKGISGEKGWAIRDTSRGGSREPLPHGRARKLLEIEEVNGTLMRGGEPYELREEDCCCSEWLTSPSGIIYQCGCAESPIIGNVFEGIFNSNASGYCWLSTEFQMTQGGDFDN